MTTAELERVAASAAPAKVTQTAAVEQARAIAEVQAAVTVAQQLPRDVARALGEMRDACGRLALAKQAFYSVKNRGSGPSVHLARELARIWGHVDYGVRELRRDDEGGYSEIQAYAWDQQTNTRSSRTFQVPHVRMRDGKRVPLTDVQDVYLNNQNIGARAVRECIYTVLPAYLVDEAEQLCKRTISDGEGKPLEQRVTEMIGGFRGIHVTLPMLERRIGHKRGQWTADDVVQMGVVYQSISRGETTVAEEFPAGEDITADLLSGAQ